MTRVTLLDSGTGNLFSLREAFCREGLSVDVTTSGAAVRAARCLVLPGVASFPAVVRGISDTRRSILALAADGVPLLGICAGMQILFESSEEGPGEGLGLFPGKVRALRADVVPHMGWSLLDARPDPWLQGLQDGSMVYFAHSFAAPSAGAHVVATSDHGGPFAAAVRKGSVFGVQFHPEKSGRVGRAVLRGFLKESGVIRSG